MSVMNGFRVELQSKILGFNGHVVVTPIETTLTDFAAVTQRIAAAPGVTLALPIVEGPALASSPFSAVGVLVRGVRASELARLSSIASNVKEGTLQGFDDSGGVMVGSRLAETLGLRLGDNITLTAPRGAATAFGITPRIKSYRIDAIFTIGMSEVDSNFVFMPLAEGQAYFNHDDDVTAIEVYVDDPDKVDDERAAIEAAAQRPIAMTDWRQRNATFFSALEVERNVMFLILTLIILVAALNIVSGLIMLVKDKGADIAILRTMGATRGAVMRIFLITGTAIGTVGTLGGFLLGVVVCTYIEEIRQFLSWLLNTNLFPGELYFLSRLPAKMDPGEVAGVVLMSLVLSVLATLYPSWRAARLDPVQALRYE
jgi:lipoprotein-releasing system permease protein